MHPNKFFNEVTFLDVAYPGVITKQVLDKMKDVHPSQFINSDITIPFFKVEYSYTNAKGSSKDGSKYVFVDTYHDDVSLEVQDKFESWVTKFNEAHPYTLMLNVSVTNVIPIANARLTIGIETASHTSSVKNPSV